MLKLGLLAITFLLIGVGVFFYVNQRLGKSIPPYQQEKSTGAESSREKTLAAPEISSEGYARLIKEVQPAIVTIQTYDKSGEERSLGSGFFINDKGHLITNYHVIKDSYYAIIKFPDGKETKVYTNKAIGIDRKADLVKIQVKLQKLSANYLKIAESPPEVGERIIVVESPLGLEQTVSDGVISGIRQVDDLKFIQISAIISPGSSGGPVVNLKGEVVGVATFQFKGGQNINFAIPASKILALGEKEDEIELAERGLQAPFTQQSKQTQKQPISGFDGEWIQVANHPYYNFFEDDGRALLIGVGQGGALHPGKAQVIAFANLPVDTEDQVAQTFATAPLAEEHSPQVRPIGELPGVRPLPGMAVYQVIENMSRYEL